MRRIAVSIAALALLLPLVGGCAPREPAEAQAGPAVAWPQTPCRATVEAFLGMGGLSLAQMEAVRVREERLNGGQPGEQVGFWHLSGRPASCAKGDLALTILPDCAIYSWKTSGGCRVSGLEASR